MKVRRQRVWLTAIAIAGSVALYGCGGGSSPDTTPYDQAALDQAAADAAAAAKKAAEDKAAAIAAVTAEAEKAAAAAADAKKAQDDAAMYAATATLDVAKAKAAADAAQTAATAAMAASTAANAVDHASAEVAAQKTAAANSASEASASASAASGSHMTAMALQADRDDQSQKAVTAGTNANIASVQAGLAAAAADAAAAQVAKAKDAKTVAAAATAAAAAKASETEAKTARDAAKAASDAAAAVDSSEAAVQMQKNAAASSATAADGSVEKASLAAIQAQGWADAHMTGKYASGGKDGLASHAELKAVVPWIKDPSESAVALDDYADDAMDAAGRLADQTSSTSDATAAYQADIATALSNAKSAASATTDDDLMDAQKAYNAAVPWSENGMMVDDGDNLASGDVLNHPDGQIALGGTNIVAGAHNSNNERSAYDADLGVIGIRSYSDAVKPAGIAATSTERRAAYQLVHINQWKAGRNGVYDYVNFGVWTQTEKNNRYVVVAGPNNNPPADTQSNAFDNSLVGSGAFVFANDGSPTSGAVTGTATYNGHHVSVLSFDEGSGENGDDIFNLITDTNNATGNRVVSGASSTSINFAKASDVTVTLYNSDTIADANRYYHISGIKLDGNMLSGGEYGDTPDGISVGLSNYSFNVTNVVAADAEPTVTLHGGTFGPKAEEVAGTINVSATNPHGQPATTSNARDASLELNTAFGGRNVNFN